MNRASEPSSRPPAAVFLAASVVMFVLTLSAADSIGFVPCQLDGTCASVTLADLPQLGESATSTTQSAQGILPVRISIPVINLDLPIQNPSTTDVDALDALLNKGPARHPQSAKLGESGNMIIFGHSSHLAIAHPMFKAFNGVPDLQAGDPVTVEGADGMQYLYSVDGVAKADASTDTENFLANPGKKLYIITCDNFSGKSARYILTAHFVGMVNASAQ